MLRVDEVQDSPAFPEEVDVAIIGGGIIGITTAYELALKGVRVAVLEKGFIGAEQSGRNWGWVRQQNRDHYELPVAMKSLQRWGQMSDEIGRDLGFRRTGILYGSLNAADVATWERWGKRAKEIGFSSDVLSAAQLQARVPTGSAHWAGGVWSPTDGRAEPSKAAPAIAEGAKQRGASIHQTCAVRGLDISAGRVSGVWTERGLIRASTVVCAGGAWSSRLLSRHGVELPIANIAGTAMRTSAAPEVISGCFSGPGFALRRRLDGGYTLAVPGHGTMDLTPRNLRYSLKFYQTFRSKLSKKLKFHAGRSFFHGPDAAGTWNMDEISPFEQIRVLDPAPDAELVALAVKNLTATFPELAGIRVVQAWGGLIDTAPDLVPVISTVETLPGLIVASGFSGHGFGLGPGAGVLIAEMATQRTPYVDIAPFRLSRFSDGSRIRRPEMM